MVNVWRCMLLLSLTSSCWGQSVKLPAEVKGEVGAWIVVVPESKEGGDVKWRVGPGLTRVPIEQLFPGQKAAGVVVQATAKGRYEVLAWNAKGDVASDLAVCTVVIGGAPPVPPDPGPTPPTPNPPDDPLYQPLLAAYYAETTTEKVELKNKLASLYRVGAEYVRKPEIATWGALFTIMSTAAEQSGVKGKLPAMQTVLQVELVKALPTDAAKALDAEGREKAAALFSRLAKVIEGVR